jgi:hypothetical protein
MEKHSTAGEHGRQRRVRRWVREILLAVVLTVAAAVFIAVALLRGGANPQDAPSFETARKPATR